MKIDPSMMLEKAAMIFFQQQQPLMAAICFAELVKQKPESPAFWCGLGSAACNCVGVFVREPFFRWAAKSFHRGLPLAAGTPYEAVMREWLTKMSADFDPTTVGPLRDDEIPEMLDFFVINDQIFVDGIRGLREDDRSFIIMALGDQRNALFLPALLAAIEGHFGDTAARSALKRISPFAQTPAVRASIQAVAQSPRAESLQPYLEWAAKSVDEAWANDLFAHRHDQSAEAPSTTPSPEAPEEAASEDTPSAESATPPQKPWWKFW